MKYLVPYITICFAAGYIISIAVWIYMKIQFAKRKIEESERKAYDTYKKAA